jgi:hypothetical protein
MPSNAPVCGPQPGSGRKASSNRGRDPVDIRAMCRIDGNQFSPTHRLIELSERLVVHEAPRMRGMDSLRNLLPRG